MTAIEGMLPLPMLPQDWKQRAACRGMDTTLWFPERGDLTTSTYARQVCRECPVSAECATYAVAVGAENGIWGGLTERERRNRGGRVRLPAPCGTIAGWRRHRRSNEQTCELCRAAYTQYSLVIRSERKVRRG